MLTREKKWITMYHKKLHFMQKDIQVLYYNNDDIHKYKSFDNGEYSAIMFFSGKASIAYKDKIYILRPGDLFIAHKSEEFVVTGRCECLQMRFWAAFFHEIDDQIDILAPFHNKDIIKVYHKEVTDTEDFQTAVKSMLRALEQHCNRAFVMSAALQLICALNYYCDSINPPVPKETDSNYAKIAFYIDEHVFEDISLESVSKAVFLSKRCISDTIRRICGISFRDLIAEKRLLQARQLLRANSLSISSIATLCGFSTYSTFFRNYTEYFGVSPKSYRESWLKLNEPPHLR